MNEKSKCPNCGAALPADAPEGLCPRCLGALGIETDTIVTGAATAGAAWTPPSIAELGPLFPQLELLGLIGRGGMGAVYQARQKQLDRVVALKILPPGIGSDPAFAGRFAREAKALARLNHPGIVTIHDFGQAGGLFYLLMEFVDGVSLRQLMNTGRVSPREALAIVPQICDALQYAHDQGIVHRDIKPENILLNRQGRVKVADFGLAKLVGTRTEGPSLGSVGPSTAANLTEAGKVMGTPQYMAPEQTEHPDAVDHRADIYALGMVFYQMLTGELPGGRIEPPSKKVHIDVRLDEVVLRALEKEPQRRYQQVSEVKSAVETIVQTAPAATKGGRAAWKGALVGVVTVIAAVAAWIFFRPSSPSSAPSPSVEQTRVRPPESTNANIGEPASFAVASNGTAPMTYQWRFDGSNTSGTVSSNLTVEQILARYAQAKGPMAGADKTRTLTLKGVFSSRDGMNNMEAEGYVKAPDKWLMVLKDANGPVFQRGFDGSTGWEVSKWGPTNVSPGMLMQHQLFIGTYRGEPLTMLVPLARLKGREPLGSGEAYVVEVAFPGEPVQLWFDTRTGLLLRVEYKFKLRAGNRSLVQQIDWEDYRDIGGLMVPFKIRESGAENCTVKCSEVRLNEPIDDARFTRPPAAGQ